MTTGACDSIIAVTPAPNIGSDDIATLRAALAAEQMARREAEARASGAEAMVAHLKLMIAKLRHDQYGASSERGRKLIDQMELELEELEAGAAEDATAVPQPDADSTNVHAFIRRKPVLGPLPAHLPRERVVTSWSNRMPRLWRCSRQAGRDHHGDAGGHPASVEGGPDSAGEVHLSCLRDHHPAAGTVPSDLSWPRRAEPAGDDPGRDVREPPSVELSERGLCARASDLSS